MADNYKGPLSRSNSSITGKNNSSNTEIRHDGNDNVDLTSNHDENVKLTGSSGGSNTALTSGSSKPSSISGRTHTGDVVDYWTKDVYKNRQKKFDQTLKGLEDKEKSLKEEKLKLTREKNKIINDTTLSQEEKAKVLNKIKARQIEIDTKEIPATLKERSKMLDSFENQNRIRRGELGLDGQAGYNKAKQYERMGADVNSRIASTTTSSSEARKFSTLADKYQSQANKGPGKTLSFKNRVRQGINKRIKPVRQAYQKATRPIKNAANKVASPIKHSVRMGAKKAAKAALKIGQQLISALYQLLINVVTFLVSNPIGWIILCILIAFVVEILIIMAGSIVIPNDVAGTVETVKPAERYSRANAQVRSTATWANKMKKQFYEKYHVTLNNADVMAILLSYTSSEELDKIVAAFDDEGLSTSEDYEEKMSEYLEEIWPYERYEDVAELWLDKVHYDFYYLVRNYGTWKYVGYEGKTIQGGHDHADLDKNLKAYQDQLLNYTNSVTANGNYEIVSWTGYVTEIYQWEDVWFEDEEQCEMVTDKKTGLKKEVCTTVSVRRSKWVDATREVESTFYAYREITLETWTGDIGNPNIDWNADRSKGAPKSVNRANAQVVKAPDPPKYPNGTTDPNFKGNIGDHDQYWIKIELINGGYRKRHRSWEIKETALYKFDEDNPEEVEKAHETVYYNLSFDFMPKSADEKTETLYKEDKLCEGPKCTGQTVGIEYNKENIYQMMFYDNLFPVNEEFQKHLWVKARDYRELYKDVTPSAKGLDNLENFFPDFTMIEYWRNIWDSPVGKNTYRYYGQCTWFAQGVFMQIYSELIPDLYEILPMFSGNGIDIVGNFTQNNPYFTQQDTPAPGAIISMSSSLFPMYGHVGIVLSVEDETVKYIDGNYNGQTDPWEVAIHDWGYSTKTISQLEAVGATYAVYNGEDK